MRVAESTSRDLVGGFGGPLHVGLGLGGVTAHTPGGRPRAVSRAPGNSLVPAGATGQGCGKCLQVYGQLDPEFTVGGGHGRLEGPTPKVPQFPCVPYPNPTGLGLAGQQRVKWGWQPMRVGG